ncbi:MAG: hypothetical protein HeimC2_20660 [Candidatus Heimdallarchaeota archaeon LC_2]|nr:MAG: hypothetical protein HeimC2_20660 [Candidatus Heimdallarchaeota archaeon LC_2]
MEVSFIITKLPEPALEIVEKLTQHEFQILSQEDIRNALSISSQKSIRYAIRRLLENGIIYRVANLMDMRSVSYRLATPNELTDAFNNLSDKVFQDVLIAMNIPNAQLSQYKAFVKSN